MNPHVFIAIPNWNGKELLDDCLTTLFNVTEYPNFSVVVVDNGSDDGSVDLLRQDYPDVTVIENGSNRGWGRANNQVFDLAIEEGVEYILLLNNDSKIVDEAWLTTLVGTAESTAEFGMIACRSVEPDGTVHYDGRNFPLSESIFPTLSDVYDYNKFERDNDSAEYQIVDQVVGAILVSADLIDSIGGFDEAYAPIYWEDSDFCVRAWDAGFRVVYTPETRIEHIRQATSSELDPILKAYYVRRNHVRFVLTNYPLGWILRGLPQIVGRQMMFFFDEFPRPREELVESPSHTLKYGGKAVTDVLKDLPSIIADRRRRSNIRELTK